MKKLILFSLVVFASGAGAQTLQVINAAGKSYAPVNGIYLTDNVGEPFVSSISSGGLMLTQGFLQADDDVVIIDIGGVKIFNAVTPNGDGKNDKWFIENITEFPDNHVMLFSRWGKKIYDAKGYDNEAVYWPSDDDVNRQPSGTYFYIIELGNGSTPLKGWVELIKN